MSHLLDIDPRFDDCRAYTPRHGLPEPAVEPVPRPVWADERARTLPRVPGEGVTQKIRYPDWRIPPALPMPLPARARGAALEALRIPPALPKLPPLVALLGRCLRALPFGGPR